jgi:hypothetical protein
MKVGTQNTRPIWSQDKATRKEATPPSQAKQEEWWHIEQPQHLNSSFPFFLVR